MMSLAHTQVVLLETETRRVTAKFAVLPSEVMYFGKHDYSRFRFQVVVQKVGTYPNLLGVPEKQYTECQDDPWSLLPESLHRYKEYLGLPLWYYNINIEEALREACVPKVPKQQVTVDGIPCWVVKKSKELSLAAEQPPGSIPLLTKGSVKPDKQRIRELTSWYSATDKELQFKGLEQRLLKLRQSRMKFYYDMIWLFGGDGFNASFKRL